MSRIGSLLLGLLLLLAIVWVGRRVSLGADEKGLGEINAAWAAAHETQLRRVLDVPPPMQLEFRAVHESPLPDYYVVSFDVVDGSVRHRVALYVSHDGRRVRDQERVYDLDDPFRALREQIQLENVPLRGPANAPVTVVEYSDYTCAYCGQFFATLEKPLRERYGSKVRLAYKNFPLTDSRPWAEDAAVAGACAFRQGNEPFWKLHEKLFQAAPRLRQGRPVLTQLAEEAGLDVPVFSKCLEQGEARADVARDQQEGERLGVDGTPTFFVNGRPIPGLVSPQHFFQIVDEELAAAPPR